MSEIGLAAALLDPSLTAPEGLRFDIYRNSVTAGLIRNLETGFPVIRQLVGAAFFTAMATEFVRAHPPRDQVMTLYGGAFTGFLATFAPVVAYPYLTDVARLEQALRESYHAADGNPFAEPKIYLDASVTLAPSLRLIRSPWPIHSIWQFHREAGPKPIFQTQDVVILRPEYDPSPHLLLPEAGDFLSGLMRGMTVRQARAPLASDFPYQTVLDLLTENHAIRSK